jgi:hypothetical protein
LYAYAAAVGPNDPWSPQWRPDEQRERLRRIHVVRRGALLAGALWVPVSLVAAWQSDVPLQLTVIVVVVGTAGIALLGAGLANGALGSRIDAAIAGVALGIGAPVAAVASMVIAGFLFDSLYGESRDLAGTVLRGGVIAAVRVIPLVAWAAIAWVIGVRRFATRLGIEAPPSGTHTMSGPPDREHRSDR